MKGSLIAVGTPYGQRKEGIISGTPKPGTHMQVKTAVEPVGGRPTWEAFSPATGGGPSLGGDGVPGLIAVLDLDDLQGFGFNTSYVSGRQGAVWVPLPGDECNLRKADIAGTGTATEDLAIGDRLLVVQGTGFISKVAVGLVASPVAYPWQALETLVDQPAETLVHCLRTGQ